MGVLPEYLQLLELQQMQLCWALLLRLVGLVVVLVVFVELLYYKVKELSTIYKFLATKHSILAT